jgi:SAM-dependent methyltransferase
VIEMTDRYYEDHALDYFERTVSADLSQTHERFLRYLPFRGRILDAGCGSGRDLRAFSQRGFQAIGIDASPALVKLAKAYSGVECTVARLEEITYESCFDGIWACASLLHLPKIVLPSALQRLLNALVPGGALFASLQAGEGEVVTEDGRFFAYYQHDEILGIVRGAGFQIVETWFSADALPDRTDVRWINLIAQSNTSP